MDIERHRPEVERIERFQSLKSGQYWKAIDAVPAECIEKGEVLLVQSIRWVDDAMHTVILRTHPSKHGEYQSVVSFDDAGSRVTRSVKFTEHRFLLADFLDRFEFEPDARSIRAREIQAIHDRVSDLQAEVAEFGSNPALVERVVEEGLHAKDEAASKGPGDLLPVPTGRAAEEAASVATGSLSNALSGGITPGKIEILKAAAGRQLQIATIKAEWIKARTKEMTENFAKLTPFLEEEAAVVLAQSEDMGSYVSKLTKGIESLELYVGKDVEVEEIAKGPSAPRELPLTVVQKKLAVDEELALYLDVDEWFDYSQDSRFFDALRSHPGLVDQIFPTERCVVVMASTRRWIDYGNAWTNAQKNAINREVFLMVRDGANISRVFSPLTSHLRAARLFPRFDEGERFFRGVDGSRIGFDDVAFTDRLESHQSEALHYKRFLILAAGLDHRLKLFGDFYDGDVSLDFVSMEFQERHFAFIRDDDPRYALPGGRKPLPLRDFVKQCNRYLQPGSRVACNWLWLLTPETAPAACEESQRRDGTGRGFTLRVDPDKRVEVVIAFKSGNSTCVEAAVTRRHGRARGNRFNCKVDLTAFEQERDEQIGYLCLDKVSPEDLDWYMRSRDAREDHLSYIRFFKLALKALTAERANEADTRARMAAALDEGGVAEPGDIPSIVDEAVSAWRSANRGKPLPAFDGDIAPAGWKALLDSMYHLAKGPGERLAKAERLAAGLGIEPLRIVLAGDGKMALYAVPPVVDDRVEPHSWTLRIGLDFKRDEAVERGRRNVVMQSVTASETVLKEWPAASAWADRAACFQSPERKAQALDAIEAFPCMLRWFTRPMSEELFEEVFGTWKDAVSRLAAKSQWYASPSLAIPFGAAVVKGKLRLLCLGHEKPFVLLHRFAPDDAARDRLFASTVAPWSNRERRREQLSRDVDAAPGWTVIVTDAGTGADERGFFDAQLRFDNLDVARHDNVDPLLATRLDLWVKREKWSPWYAPAALDADGRLALDDMLGVRRPDGWGPYTVMSVNLREQGKSGKPPVAKFIDVKLSGKPNHLDGEAWLGKGANRFAMSTSSRVVATLDDAHAAVAYEGRSGLLPEPPPQCAPPEGVERWCFAAK